MGDDADALLTMTEAAALVGLNPKTLRWYVHEGRLKVERPYPRVVMTTRRHLKALMDERKERRDGKKHPGRKPKSIPGEALPPMKAGRPRKPTIKPPVPPAADTR